MRSLHDVMATMVEEMNAGIAQYHWEDDGEEYRLLRDGAVVAGVSHRYAAQNPMLKYAIEACFHAHKDKSNG